jgi:hypothetical protein
MTDWDSLQHARGDAGDVPALLERIAGGSDDADAVVALDELGARVLHDQTLYPATPAVVAPLIDLLRHGSAVRVTKAIGLLCELVTCRGYHHWYGFPPEDPRDPEQQRAVLAEEAGWLARSTELLRARAPGLLVDLSTGGPALRAHALRLLSLFPEERAAVAPIVAARLQREDDPLVVLALAHAPSRLALDIPGWETTLRAWLSSGARVRRAAAAGALGHALGAGAGAEVLEILAEETAGEPLPEWDLGPWHEYGYRVDMCRLALRWGRPHAERLVSIVTAALAAADYNGSRLAGLALQFAFDPSSSSSSSSSSPSPPPPSQAQGALLAAILRTERAWEEPLHIMTVLADRGLPQRPSEIARYLGVEAEPLGDTWTRGLVSVADGYATFEPGIPMDDVMAALGMRR